MLSGHIPLRNSVREQAPLVQAWTALVVGAAAALVVSINIAGTNIAFPAIEEAFPDTPRSVLSWTISGYGLGLASFLLVGGRLADRYGRRRILLWGVAGLLVSSLLTAASPTAYMLIVMRFVQAMAAALVLPSSLAVALPGFPAAFRGRAIATWAGANSIGAALGPTLSALVVQWLSWRGVYLLGVPVLVAVLVIGPRVLHETRGPVSSARLDWLGVVLATIAVGALVFAVSQTTSLGWTSRWVIGAGMLAAVLLPLFVHRCRSQPEPLLDLHLFGMRTVWSTNLANLFMSMVGMSIWLVWPLFLTRVWNYSPIRAGLAISVGPANALVWSIVAGRIVDRRGPRTLMALGSLLPICATAWFVLRLTAEPAYLTRFLPGLLLNSCGFGLTFSALNAASLAGVPDGAIGQVNAAFNTGRNLAAALGTAAVIAILGSSITVDAFNRAFLLLACFAAFAAATIWVAYPAAPGARKADAR